MMEKLLITGIDGFLGSHLAKMLSRSYRVIGLVRDKVNTKRICGNDYPLYNSSDQDLEALFDEHALWGIIHAATVYQAESFDLVYNTNVKLPVNLLQQGMKNGLEVFINTDSFFNSDKYLSYNYLNEYTQTKRDCLERLSRLAENWTKGKLINMKIFHMYGPNDSEFKFIPSIIKKLIANERVIPLTKGEQERDFIYVEDVCTAYETALNRLDRLPPFQEFEVGTGISTSIRELIVLARVVFASESGLEFGALPYRENEILYAVAENDSLRKLGWKQMISNEEGLRRIRNY